MSMTQEEIEALMNDTTSAETEESPIEEESIDDILAGIEGIEDDGSTIEESSESIDDILAGIDGIVDEESQASDVDDILAGIDGIVDDESSKSTNIEETPKQPTITDQINNGIYPMPVENEHKVVNQLNEVAEDSEEKASQIFDVLSFILYENDLVSKNAIKVSEFLESQIKLLETLNNKFPNIEVFSQNIEQANETKIAIDEITNSLDSENNKVFEAMELMQFHDINRQKIERVMAVIRKLANYLSGIFADDSTKAEVQIAQHISGDGQETVNEDDLDSLIAEFNK